MLIQTTVTGQLALLMLIENIELAGFTVVSANTDGIVEVIMCFLSWFASASPLLERLGDRLPARRYS